MTTYKITSHFLPWEIDYCMLMYMQLKKSKYYLSGEDTIKVNMVLNLSDHLIDWNKSQIPKSFFKEKFSNLAPLLKDYIFTSSIYEDNELYGCLDAVRETVEPNIDYYINISPDMYFSEHLLYYMIEASKSITNKYFVLIPEIPKMWDVTWDTITNAQHMNTPYNEWDKQDIFDIRNKLKNNSEEIKVRAVNEHKWAGWFDLYNKAYYEELVPVRPDWRGYGPYDYYSMMITQYGKSKGIDFQQYVLQNQISFEYSIGPLKDTGFSKYYKNHLVMKEIPSQRLQFEQNMRQYLNDWVVKNNI